MFIAAFGLCWLWYWFTTWGLRVYLFCSRCDLLDFFSLLCGVVVGFCCVMCCCGLLGGVVVWYGWDGLFVICVVCSVVLVFGLPGWLGGA